MFGTRKKNTTIKTEIGACSLLAKYAFSDQVRERAISLTINFEQVIKPFLIWNIYFSFFLALVDYSFYKSTIESTVYYYYVTYASEAVVRRCSVKKAFLEISQNSQENTCARVSFFKKETLAQVFSCDFAKFLTTLFLTEHL